MKGDSNHYIKSITLTIFLLLSISVFSTGFLVQRTKADSDTVFIQADGSIAPSTAPIERTGETYTLTGDIAGSIVIKKDDIVVDGAGYTVQGVGNLGLNLSSTCNVTVCNFTVVGFSVGVGLNSSNNNAIISNNLTGNAYAGIQLHSSNHNQIFNNIASNSKYGIRVVNSSGCNLCWNNVTNNNPVGIFLNSRPSSTSNFLLFENNLSNNGVGVWLWNSSGNTIYHNHFFNNSIQVSLHNSYGNNWDNGFEGNYWSDYSGSDVDNDAVGDESYSIDENNQDDYPLITYGTKVTVVKPVPFWLQWWFWGICILTATTATFFRKYVQQRKTIEMYKRQLESFQEVSHIEKTKMLFEADVRRCRRKLVELTEKHGLRIRHREESFEDALKRMGIEEKNKK